MGFEQVAQMKQQQAQRWAMMTPNQADYVSAFKGYRPMDSLPADPMQAKRQEMLQGGLLSHRKSFMFQQAAKMKQQKGMQEARMGPSLSNYSGDRSTYPMNAPMTQAPPPVTTSLSNYISRGSSAGLENSKSARVQFNGTGYDNPGLGRNTSNELSPQGSQVANLTNNGFRSVNMIDNRAIRGNAAQVLSTKF